MLLGDSGVQIVNAKKPELLEVLVQEGRTLGMLRIIYQDTYIYTIYNIGFEFLFF